MGTHPIFESDFDCLTEWLKRIRIYSELNSETINGNMPIQQLSNIQPNMLEKMIEAIQFFQIVPAVTLFMENQMLIIGKKELSRELLKTHGRKLHGRLTKKNLDKMLLQCP